MVRYVKEEEQITALEKSKLEQIVSEIIAQVKKNGDEALRNYSRQFDGVDLAQIQVSADEILQAEKQLPETVKTDIDFTIERIKAFAEAQRQTLSEFEQEMIPGVHLGQKVIPIESVGAYVPGGRYPLMSSAQMSIIPAKVAGASTIRVCTPPTKDGIVPAAVLYAAHQSGADEIFAVGGAQAIAALAYGTESIQPVHKIAGPGNRYVTEAKRLVHGVVGIDLLAGPSEVLVVADDSAKANYVAADLLAQAEHDVDARAILITNSDELADQVIEEIEHQLSTLPTSEVAHTAWQRRGQVIVTDTLVEAIKHTNSLAPEHLHVQIRDAKDYLDQFTNYGSLFLGENSSVVYADKLCGTNHILPTNEAAKYTGGVWVGSFLKVVTYQWIEAEGIKRLAPPCVRQSSREGLIGHRRSANIRLTGTLD